MSNAQRIYNAAVLHIEAFHLELERDGRTMLLADQRMGWIGSTRLPWMGGKHRAIIELVHMHITHMNRQEERLSILRDLENISG